MGDETAGVTRWRKRPVIVSAIQWTGANFAAVRDFASGALGAGEVAKGAVPLWVVKSQALCHVQRGDWIIRESDGSGFCPCAADVFAATYEPAGEPLSDDQCDRLRQMAGERGDALSAVRAGLDLAVPFHDSDSTVIAAAWEALKVLSGEEERDGA